MDGESPDKIMRAAADRIEKIAFDMKAPNPYTPQFVEVAVALRDAAMDHERKQKAGYRRLVRNLSQPTGDPHGR